MKDKYKYVVRVSLNVDGYYFDSRKNVKYNCLTRSKIFNFRIGFSFEYSKKYLNSLFLKKFDFVYFINSEIKYKINAYIVNELKIKNKFNYQYSGVAYIFDFINDIYVGDSNLQNLGLNNPFNISGNY